MIKILLVCGLVVAPCRTTPDLPTIQKTYYCLSLPHNTELNTYSKVRYSYRYGYDKQNNIMNYSYFDDKSTLLFKYDYQRNHYTGNPFIYIFDYFCLTV